MVVKLEEPLSEKSRTWKTTARMKGWIEEGKFHAAPGKILLYFKKDQIPEQIHSGSVIMFLQDLKKIKNTGNHGSFDFEEYSLFQGITHQVYLEKKDWILVSEDEHAFSRFISLAMQRVLSVIIIIIH
jgi:competence protein ComEC